MTLDERHEANQDLHRPKLFADMCPTNFLLQACGRICHGHSRYRTLCVCSLVCYQPDIDNPSSQRQRSVSLKVRLWKLNDPRTVSAKTNSRSTFFRACSRVDPNTHPVPQNSSPLPPLLVFVKNTHTVVPERLYTSILDLATVQTSP